MMGKGIWTPNFSLMFRVQARCEKMLSMESPRSSQFMAANSSACLAKPMNSVVQTGVKSDGWEKRISHLPR
jgi:hypothetical protein